MKKKIILLALFVLLISGCGSKIPTLSNGDEAVVTLKGSMISANDLYNDVRNSDYALQKLITKVDKEILEKEYSDKLEEAKASAETQIAQLEQYYGDSLENVIKQQTDFESIAEYQDYVYLGYLQRLAITDYCKKQLTDKDVEKYYKDEVVGDIKVSHILITSKATDDMTDEEKAAAETEAKEKAQAIIDELNKTAKGEVADKFAELAAAQSDDEVTKNNGGSFGWINKDTLSSNYAELVDAAYKLKDGEYSTKLITTELGYEIILRTETKDKEPLENLKDSILETLAGKYLEKNSVANVKALQELRKENDFEIVDSDLKSRYAQYIQESLTYYQQLDEQNNNKNSNNN